jgi:hypothetical protein
VDNDGEFLLIEGVGAMVEGLDGPEVGANKVSTHCIFKETRD